MFHQIQDDERLRARLMIVVRSVPTTAGSGAAKIHVSLWNIFMTAFKVVKLFLKHPVFTYYQFILCLLVDLVTSVS
jgi:hypothetical protein